MEDEQTRLCVKQLPKYLKEERLRSIFSAHGDITDVKIVRTADGKSRLFGFVGFTTKKAAVAAREHLNNTFIDTSKITVELAKAGRW